MPSDNAEKDPSRLEVLSSSAREWEVDGSLVLIDRGLYSRVDQSLFLLAASQYGTTLTMLSFIRI